MRNKAQHNLNFHNYYQLLKYFAIVELNLKRFLINTKYIINHKKQYKYKLLF